MFNKLKNFLFPDDTKIKIECAQYVSVNENGQANVVTRFYTLRSFWKHYTGEIKKYIKDVYEFHTLKPFPEYHLSLQRGAIAIGTTTQGVNSGDTITVSCTPSGSNVAIVIGVGGVRALVSAVYNTSESLTLLTEQSGGAGRCNIAYLVNPTITTANVVATLASIGSTSMGVTIFSGANTGSLIDVQGGSNYIGASSVSTGVTTTYANSILIDVITGQANQTPDASQTQIWNQAPSNFDEGSYKATTTAGAKTMDWTMSASTGSHKVAAIREYVAAGPANLKSYNTNLAANVKSVDTNLIANVKTLDTNL